MNEWLIAAAAMLFTFIPCGIVCMRGKAIDRVAGLETAGTMAVITLVLLSEGFQRIPFYDLPLTLALLSFAGALVFARFIERWM